MIDVVRKPYGKATKQNQIRALNQGETFTQPCHDKQTLLRTSDYNEQRRSQECELLDQSNEIDRSDKNTESVNELSRIENLKKTQTVYKHRKDNNTEISKIMEKPTREQHMGNMEVLMRMDKRNQLDQRKKELQNEIKDRRKIIEAQSVTPQNSDIESELNHPQAGVFSETFQPEDSDGENPKIMDIKVVMQMFQELKAQGSIPHGVQRIQKIEQRQDDQETRLLRIEDELNECKMRNQILSGVVSRMGQIMKETDRRIELIELNNMRKSIVVTGFHTERRKDRCISDMYNFLSEEVGVEVQIEDLFFLNKETTSPLVITMTSMEDKREIFRNMKNIKGLVNMDGKPFIFSDYLPPELNESKRREREIYRDYMSSNEDVALEWNAGKLIIDGQPYAKKITPPDTSDILQITNQQT